MTTAGQLLRQSDAPLQGIAAQTGYSSEFAFNRAFKREYGASPGSYRRRVGSAVARAHHHTRAQVQGRAPSQVFVPGARVNAGLGLPE